MSLANANAETNSEADANRQTMALIRQVNDFHYEMESLAWGAEQLWHSEFRREQDNEFLSRFPVAILRLAALQAEAMHKQSEKLENALR